MNPVIQLELVDFLETRKYICSQLGVCKLWELSRDAVKLPQIPVSENLMEVDSSMLEYWKGEIANCEIYTVDINFSHHNEERRIQMVEKGLTQCHE